MHVIDYAMSFPGVESSALDVALRAALPNKIFGVSTYGWGRPISICLDDTAGPTDDTAAQAIASNHDPVFLIAATLTPKVGDTIYVGVRAPKPGAAPVVILVGNQPVTVTLVNGVGSVPVTSNIPVSVPIAVQNPANRSAMSLVLQFQ